MDRWEDEAKFVLKELQREDEILFRGDNETASRVQNDMFVGTWGFSYNDMWDLDKAIAMFILPRLAYYCRNNASAPSRLENEIRAYREISDEELDREWERILETICDGLHLYLEKEHSDFSKEEKLLWRKAKRYLFDYFECLWY